MGNVSGRQGDVAKARAKRIIADSIKDHVAGISPYYKGRNGSLLSIGQKGRFLHVENVERKWNRQKAENEEENGREPFCKQGQGFALATCKQLLSKNKPAKHVKDQTCKQIMVRKQLSYQRKMHKQNMIIPLLW